MKKRILALLFAVSLTGTAAAVPAYAEEIGAPEASEEIRVSDVTEENGNDSAISSVEIRGEYNKMDESEIVNGASGDKKEEEIRVYAADKTEPYADTASGSIASGALADGVAYVLPDELLNYDSEYVPTRQFACPERNGVYFLQLDKLYFLDLTSGSYKEVYDFGSRIS